MWAVQIQYSFVFFFHTCTTHTSGVSNRQFAQQRAPNGYMVTNVVGFQFSRSHYHFYSFIETVYPYSTKCLKWYRNQESIGMVSSCQSCQISMYFRAPLRHLSSVYGVRWSSHTGHTLDNLRVWISLERRNFLMNVIIVCMQRETKCSIWVWCCIWSAIPIGLWVCISHVCNKMASLQKAC